MIKKIKTLSDNKIWDLNVVDIGTGVTFAIITNNNTSKSIMIGQQQFWENTNSVFNFSCGLMGDKENFIIIKND